MGLTLPALLLGVCFLAPLRAGEAPASLADARALWRRMEPERYSYVVREHTTIVTACRVEGSRFVSRNPLRIFVRNGRVTRVESVRDGLVPESCLQNLTLFTIDWLFDYIERAQAQPGECGGQPLVEARYDATYGFPEFVEEKCVLDGSSYTIHEFRVRQ